MISKQLLKYIEKEDKLGKSKKEIKEILLSAGWHKDAVSEAFDVYYKKDKKEEKTDEAKKVEVTVEPKEKTIEVETEQDDADEGPTLVSRQGSDPRGVEPEEEKVKYKIETAQEDIKLEKSPEVKEKKRRVRPVFLIILSFVLGAAIMMAISIFFLNKSNTPAISQNNETGFEAQKIDDGKRIVEILKIQEALEKYYSEQKSYPESLSSLADIPSSSSELNYTYTLIGAPPQSYTLNIEMQSTSNAEFKVDSGFLTLKNKQGTK